MKACHGVYLKRSNAVAIIFPVHWYLQLHTYTYIHTHHLGTLECAAVPMGEASTVSHTKPHRTASTIPSTCPAP
jgi:hypothetical protein